MTTNAELFDLAVRYHRSGNLEQAEPLYRQVIQADPAHAVAHQLLGLLALQTSRHEAAGELFRRALALNPDDAASHFNLGLVHRTQGRIGEAAQCFREAVRLNPSFVDALNNLGLVLKEQGRPEEAIQRFRQALRINPDHAIASYNLGNILMDRGELAEAATCFRAALRGNPQLITAHNNLGNVLMDMGEREEAAACYAQALRLQPDHAPTRWNLARLRLLQGDFAAGWPDYELRWQKPGFEQTASRAAARLPRWDGAALDGKTILLHAEQGMGDTIQFLRYAPLVKERGGTVVLECPPALVRLVQGIAGVDQISAAGAPLPPCHVQAPLLSLPGILGTTLATIPAAVPYLRADPVLVEAWRKELEPVGGFKVGIAWQGNPHHLGDRNRSFPLTHFEALARMPGVRLVSLQKGPGADQLQRWAGRIDNPPHVNQDDRLAAQLPILDLSDRLDKAAAFIDTAAVMMSLDLVVTVDSAVAHLAGALAVPVWVALSVAPDWRWLLERSDSPWYPTMRLFRQSRLANWDEVFERLAAAVKLKIATLD